MKRNGVHFDLVNAEEAARFLTDRNFFSDDKRLPLIAIDIFNKGYSLMSGIDCDHAKHSLAHLGTSTYSKDLFEKYGGSDQMEPWHFMEMASFGDFISFYKYLFFDSPSKSVISESNSANEYALIAKRIKNLLFPAKTLRNAAAHNDCLLNTLNKKTKKSIRQIDNYLHVHLNLNESLSMADLKVNVVYDFISLPICYDQAVPYGGAKQDASKKLNRLSESFRRNSQYYSKHENISRPLGFIACVSCAFANHWSNER